ncbi:hypothetical protein HUT05_02775 [Streptomyces chartreusis]|uniref:Uncharacterized protein n=1 Tax=Streptomyces chartreusis TaxID=1969 RepID=A0A7H8TM56_STRCX|nr:hypothetical protein HUT05_02775 [Streptomyces chartreusis]
MPQQGGDAGDRGLAATTDVLRTTGPEPLLPSDEREEIMRCLGHAVNIFPDSPREALEEAEGAFDEATAQLANALAERRRALRAGWAELAPETQSTELRLALREYRELTGRLLRA